MGILIMWYLAIVFVITVLFVVVWLIYELRLDKIAEQDRDDWRELTRPVGERWPPRDDV